MASGPGGLGPVSKTAVRLAPICGAAVCVTTSASSSGSGWNCSTASHVRAQRQVPRRCCCCVIGRASAHKPVSSASAASGWRGDVNGMLGRTSDGDRPRAQKKGSVSRIADEVVGIRQFHQHGPARRLAHAQGSQGRSTRTRPARYRQLGVTLRKPHKPVVRAKGLEPSRSLEQWHLKPSCMPVSPRPQAR